jgi:hypothetical protein
MAPAPPGRCPQPVPFPPRQAQWFQERGQAGQRGRCPPDGAPGAALAAARRVNTGESMFQSSAGLGGSGRRHRAGELIRPARLTSLSKRKQEQGEGGV